MSGNFAIKLRGGGRSPNGKCHLKFPFWFFAHLPYLVNSTAGQNQVRLLDSTGFNAWGLHNSLANLMSSPWNKGIQVKRVRYILYVSKDFFKQCELLVVAISELIDQTKCDVLKCVVLYHHKQINQGKAVVYKPFSFFQSGRRLNLTPSILPSHLGRIIKLQWKECSHPLSDFHTFWHLFSI